ncbi:hemolysin family protein [Marinilabiliaceae bacterium ANBcel2]|nr:hemolysin family protein [Marinilabiliaceae bacterium ANBcel2]
MNQFSIILITIVLSAFFSGSEMAFLSTNKLIIELNRKRHPFLSKITDLFHRNAGLFISTILIGNNIALVIYGIVTANLIEPELAKYFNSDFSILMAKTVISTIVILIGAEFVPKIIFRLNPGATLNILALPLLAFYGVFYPLSRLTLNISNFFIKQVLKAPEKPQKERLIIGRVDLNYLISDQQEKAKEQLPLPEEMKFFKNALDFSDVKVRECSVPRTELEAVDIEEDLEIVKERFIETGFSKILVYKESIDNIVGYAHVSSLFKNPQKLKNVVSPISVVPETMMASKLLEIFTKKHKSIVLVVDEFGGTSGIVTLEDILEEIFGEIDDEHDTSDMIEKKIENNIFQFSGRLEIDYLNEKYNINLPVSNEYETLAGLILYLNESIPEPEEKIETESFIFKIKKASKSKIELVQIELLNNLK